MVIVRQTDMGWGNYWMWERGSSYEEDVDKLVPTGIALEPLKRLSTFRHRKRVARLQGAFALYWYTLRI
jgi:hypothetical protein